MRLGKEKKKKHRHTQRKGKPSFSNLQQVRDEMAPQTAIRLQGLFSESFFLG